jgi:prepilin signal peptidase PulO-like enzyme (type II secretory pathway)
MVIAIIILAWLGLAFGSFVNALVWRVHEQSKHQHKKTKSKKKENLSIINGRSVCPDCRHTLAWHDLIPVISWILLRARCRYCKKPISWQYPVVELMGAVIFAGSYIFWPGSVDTAGDWVLLVTWLATAVGLLALAVYDSKWMLLPNKIIYPTFFIAACGRLIYIIGFAPQKWLALLMWATSVAVASGIFWLLFIASAGKWIGFGDIRLGIITGTVLAQPAKSFLMILLASILGTLFALPGLFSKKKTLLSKLPYGPFLIVATAITLLVGGSILDWYQKLLIK